MKSARNPHISEDRGIDLLNGLLAPDGAAETLSHLKTCAACEERFRVWSSEHETARAEWTWVAPGIDISSGTERRRFAPISKLRFGQRARRRPLQFQVGFVAAVAAGMVAVFVVPRVLRPRPASDLSAYVLSTDLQGDQRRSLPTTTDTETAAAMSKALEAYAAGDMPLAIARLGAIHAPGNMQPLRDLYLASATLLAGHAADAEQILRGSQFGNWPQPSRAEAKWVLYAALRQQGRDRPADVLLQELQQDPGDMVERVRAEAVRRNLTVR